MSRLTRKQHLNRQLRWEKRAPLSIVPEVQPETPADDADALKDGGLVLVIGGEKSRWTEHRKNAQFVFWSGDRAEIERHFRNHDNFPKNTKLVITSSFLSHHHIPRVHAEATRKGIRVLKALTNNRISHLLKAMSQLIVEPFIMKLGTIPVGEEFVGEMTEAFKVVFQTDDPSSLVKIVEEEPRPQLRAAPRGFIKAFVYDHLDVDAPVRTEWPRLLAALNEAGFTSTELSMKKFITDVRRELGITTKHLVEPTEPTVVTVTEPTEADLETIEMPTPPVTAPVKPQVAEQSFTDRLDSCVKLCDDALTQIQLIRAEAIVLKDQSSEIERVRAALRSALGL